MPKFDRELIPPAPDLSFEISFWHQGVAVAGLDEAGRGAWAGPVAAAAVILPHHMEIETILGGVRDSKQLSPAERARLAEIIHCETVWATGLASSSEIDELGILPATRLAMMRALDSLTSTPEHLLLDALFLPDESIAQTALIKGDQRSLSIAAASILAKTTRDALMLNASVEYPLYGFEKHKGYGTRQHMQMLSNFGPCPIHRKSFRPLRLINNKTRE